MAPAAPPPPPPEGAARDEAEQAAFMRSAWKTDPEAVLRARMRKRQRELAEATEAEQRAQVRSVGEPEDREAAQLELHALDMAFGKDQWTMDMRHAAIEYETHDEESGLWFVGVSIIVRLRPSDSSGRTTPHHDDIGFAWSQRRDRQQARDEALRFAGRKAHKRIVSYLYGVLPKALVDRARSSRLH
ncbi:hypothetical protein T492DRAFT_1059577 [Pavlovales sp. CCMP2436]|nr:hypothetical protein T492DRAFT_1059577 [Pavlovales sp. CCMP2436]|mmetsp:Transcript_12265/g.30914  ORF Transcript_12265/g.30914 Transcript_12265/m.30914 type:complete len:187 (-) Transcript_12265:301-861(-)|eukprot:CAMPEP_0179864214 /NCGR_PEP_ID=MMETSP0982-20121206/16033_1 /TAXON_ID=483367 /ORGANISM="non described non described, Strain CCMP 2436" /LENGTH=186 /DNA_ID=CAMNT_0021752523 /DNA_START=90 /DNA_END=653 /DNA_ORIENTATION=+